MVNRHEVGKVDCRYLHQTARHFQNHLRLQVWPRVKVPKHPNTIKNQYLDPDWYHLWWLGFPIYWVKGGTNLSPGSEHQVFRFTFPDSASETFIHHNGVNVKFASHSFLAVVNMGMRSASWDSVSGSIERISGLFSPLTGSKKPHPPLTTIIDHQPVFWKVIYLAVYN